MNYKPSVQMSKKVGALPKSAKPFINPSFLIKNKGNLSQVLQKSQSSEKLGSEHNHEGNQGEPKVNPPKESPKAVKPKIKIPEAKFKSIELKPKPLEQKQAEQKPKPMHPKFKSLKTKPQIGGMKPPEAKMKFPKSKIPPPGAKFNPSEVKFKTLVTKAKPAIGQTQENGSSSELSDEHVKMAKSMIKMSPPNEESNNSNEEVVKEDGNDKLQKDTTLNKSNYFDKKNILHVLKGKSGKEKSKLMGAGPPPMTMPKVKFPFTCEKEKEKAKEKTIDFSSAPQKENSKVNSVNSSPLQANFLVKKYTSSFSKEMVKSETSEKNAKKEDSEKEVANSETQRIPTSPIKRKASMFKSTKNISSSKVEQPHEHVHNLVKSDVMIGIAGEMPQIGPLSTRRESTLLQNTHYINAFSRFDGNYVGKVTGPPIPISSLDKTPQKLSEKKDYENELHNNTIHTNIPSPFVDFSHFVNFPFHPFTSSGRSGSVETSPFVMYPGFYYMPALACNPDWSYATGYIEEGDKRSSKRGEMGEKSSTHDIRKGRKRTETCDKGHEEMVAGGHLKPLQFRHGADWDTDDEKFLNDDVYLEEQREEETRKPKRGSANKASAKNENAKRGQKSQYIGNSKWYDIERRLNNCRGVIEDYNCSYYNEDDSDESEGGSGCEEEADTRYEDEEGNEGYYKEEGEHTYEEDTNNGNALKGKKNIWEKRKKGGKKKRGQGKNALDVGDAYNFNFDDLYKNYKIEYLNEKLKWANEYLGRKADRGADKEGSEEEIGVEERTSTQRRTSSRVGHRVKDKKKHLERLDDIAHLFLPKKKNHENLFDLSLNFSRVSDNDKNDIINMLFSCRELEKLIEEQHCVLDMLDNDLKEVNASLKLPSNWDNFENFEILQENILNAEDQGLPLNNTPLFIKGKVALVPKNLEPFLDMVPLKKESAKVAETEKTASQAYETPVNIKYIPKFAKAKVKQKIPLLMKNA
ncbi:conserved Plasmodium protein, unknown function [Plasmodium ovale]|uniref:Uncharacterized protein n=2 Tax=Plasmodium ovale TaxID=36330 RepID=A0A1A8VSA8_PLAOA|nr:conserved Plasmodium protein, unknown function [Plasmodium ovale curtisi]SBS93633.1 conserved Plasmodium protein, unknown function [Plasmodium ovale curtisi]SCA48636.1 conserved Plasmodium protein, unknown function [Plasmodium ovale]